jgi:hypothetical protein
MNSVSGVTFYTISNEPYFLGTVALLNSLRKAGNDGRLVVLDAGLSRSQRARLEEQATVVTLSGDVSRPWLLKAYPRFFDVRGVVIIIDSDMIVTGSLRRVIDYAARGKICVFPDDLSQSARWFKEWEDGFGLETSLRRQPYVNAGFIALSTQHWPGFLSRFWELSERLPSETVWAGGDASMPFWGADQDALNALLMSEIPAGAVEVLPATHEAHPDDLAKTKIVDVKTLECALDGAPVKILHYSMSPKAWDRRGWLRVRRDAYVQLFGRVACGTDVSLRLGPAELPLWLRPSASGKIALATLDIGHGIVSKIRRRLPANASDQLLRAKARLTGARQS